MFGWVVWNIKWCILMQLDFSATMAALLGVAIPFGRSGIC
jgi:hypothetical protein